jgi:hypothetical protein
VDIDDEELYQVTTPDQASWLVTAYLQAVHGAAPLRADLITAGLDPDDLTVTAGLSEHGTAAVHVTVLPVVAAHLAELITPHHNRSSPGVAAPHPGGDPNVA